MEIQNMPYGEGLLYVATMVKTTHLEGITGIYGTRIRQGSIHAVVNGKPLYFSQDIIDKLQKAIISIGTQLMNTNVTLEPQHEDGNPYCHGNDIVSKFKVLGKVIKLPFLFIDVMGRTERWQKMHLSDKNQPKYYNKFSQEDLEEINNGIHSIALRLLSVKLMYEEQGEV